MGLPTPSLLLLSLLSNDVHVISGVTNRVVKAIPVGSQPIGIAYDSTNNSVYVASSANNTVFESRNDVI
ncbi:MAG: YncE family protein [Nitrososphaeraceae archaeon]